jgi:hypothetical protein
MKVVLWGALIGLVILLVMAGPAGAGSHVVTLTFAPGKLSVASPRTTFSSSRRVRIPVTVADARGSGAGWTLRASRQVTVASITARCAANSTCTRPQATRAPHGAIVLRAARGTGMGIVELVVTLAPTEPRAVTFSVK